MLAFERQEAPGPAVAANDDAEAVFRALEKLATD
jgi:hypothetical protein